jgi:hypothetical protein
MAKVGGRTIPAFVAFLFWLLVVVLLIILFALFVHWLGGFDLRFSAGHFLFQLAVT